MSDDENGHERVPLFGTWRTAYVVVVIAFIVNVAVYYAITRIFA